MKLPDDFWAVNDEDREQSLARFIVTFAIFFLWLTAMLGIVVLIWAGQQ